MSLFGQKIESNVFLLVLLNFWFSVQFSSCDDLTARWSWWVSVFW